MRILIVRLRAIGDVIHALPVACALRDHMPGVFVAWLVEDWASKVIIGHPAIDELITVPRRWARSLGEILRLRRRLRASGFDAVLDLQGVPITLLAALLSGAPKRLGFAGMAVHGLRRLISNPDHLHSVSRAIASSLRFEPVRARSEHIVDRYLEILTPLGVSAGDARFGLPESEEDAQMIAHYLQTAGILEKHYVVINPGGRASRRWPPERFAAVATYLSSSHRLWNLVLPGVNDEERQAAEAVMAGAKEHATLAPPLPLGQLGALARRSRIFLSGDTGPLHLAAAVGAPCIGLIAHHDLADRFRPYGSANLVVRGTPALMHMLRQDGLGGDAMQAIDVDAVRQACDEILAR